MKSKEYNKKLALYAWGEVYHFSAEDKAARTRKEGAAQVLGIILGSLGS